MSAHAERLEHLLDRADSLQVRMDLIGWGPCHEVCREKYVTFAESWERLRRLLLPVLRDLPDGDLAAMPLEAALDGLEIPLVSLEMFLLALEAGTVADHMPDVIANLCMDLAGGEEAT